MLAKCPASQHCHPGGQSFNLEPLVVNLILVGLDLWVYTALVSGVEKSPQIQLVDPGLLPQSGFAESLRELIVPCFWSRCPWPSLLVGRSSHRAGSKCLERALWCWTPVLAVGPSAESTIDSLLWAGKLSSSSHGKRRKGGWRDDRTIVSTLSISEPTLYMSLSLGKDE